MTSYRSHVEQFIDELIESSKYGVVLKVMATNRCS